MKKKIMFLVCVGGYSGAENMTLLIGDEFVRRKYEVLYCSPNGEIERYIRIYHSKIQHVALEAFKFREIKKKVKLYHPNMIYAVDFRASLIASLLGHRYIIHLHNNPNWIRKASPFTFMLWYAMQHSQGNICVSDSIINEFVFSKWITNKTKTIFNVIDEQKIVDLANMPTTDNCMYEIGFIGRITEQKDPVRFLKLVHLINQTLDNNLKVLMIGADGGLLRICKQISDKSKIDVQYIGFQENPYQFLKKCKIILMPSKWEGFGLTAVESMILGIPVLASPVGGLASVVGTQENLCTTDEQFINRAVLLLTNISEYQNASLAAKKQAKLFTNIKKYADEIETIVRE